MGQRNLRRKLDAEFKANVAVEANKGEKTIAELSRLYEVYGTQVSQWKEDLIRINTDWYFRRREAEKIGDRRGYIIRRNWTAESGAGLVEKKVAQVR